MPLELQQKRQRKDWCSLQAPPIMFLVSDNIIASKLKFYFFLNICWDIPDVQAYSLVARFPHGYEEKDVIIASKLKFYFFLNICWDVPDVQAYSLVARFPHGYEEEKVA